MGGSGERAEWVEHFGYMGVGGRRDIEGIMDREDNGS